MLLVCGSGRKGKDLVERERDWYGKRFGKGNTFFWAFIFFLGNYERNKKKKSKENFFSTSFSFGNLSVKYFWDFFPIGFNIEESLCAKPATQAKPTAESRAKLAEELAKEEGEPTATTATATTRMKRVDAEPTEFASTPNSAGFSLSLALSRSVVRICGSPQGVCV